MRFFFIVALGRSGTEMLSVLLRADERASVHHEPFPMDAKMYGLRRTGRFDRVLDQYLEHRFEQLLSRTNGRFEIYGEVNSYLRYDADWLKQRFDAPVLRIYRDGRDFVRSSFIRTVYTEIEGELPTIPMSDDPYAHKWHQMNRFEKLCWYWNDTNAYLADRVADGGKMERILADYAYFKDRVLDPLGLMVTHQSWQRLVSKPRNDSSKYLRTTLLRNLVRGRSQPVKPIPHWSQWDSDMTRTFWSICGDTMSRLGYT